MTAMYYHHYIFVAMLMFAFEYCLPKKGMDISWKTMLQKFASKARKKGKTVVQCKINKTSNINCLRDMLGWDYICIS